MVRLCPAGRRHADHLLCTDELVDRYGWSLGQLSRKWHADPPVFPPPDPCYSCSRMA